MRPSWVTQYATGAGGERRTRGRPRADEDGVVLQKITVHLPPALIAEAFRRGDGNVSLGLRIICREKGF